MRGIVTLNTHEILVGLDKNVGAYNMENIATFFLMKVMPWSSLALVEKL